MAEDKVFEMVSKAQEYDQIKVSVCCTCILCVGKFTFTYSHQLSCIMLFLTTKSAAMSWALNGLTAYYVASHWLKRF